MAKKEPLRGRKPVGRPPGPSDQLTIELVAEIVDRIEKGAFPLTAALAAGVTRSTWYRWIRQAEDGSADSRVRHLLQSVERAKGRLASRYYAIVSEAALGHDRVLKKANGEPVLVPDEQGVLRPVIEKVPGQPTVAIRALEALMPDEFQRPTGGSPKGDVGRETDGESQGPDFDIVYIPSDRDPTELAEINRRIEQRASRVMAGEQQ